MQLFCEILVQSDLQPLPPYVNRQVGQCKTKHKTTLSDKVSQYSGSKVNLKSSLRTVVIRRAPAWSHGAPPQTCDLGGCPFLVIVATAGALLQASQCEHEFQFDCLYYVRAGFWDGQERWGGNRLKLVLLN